MSKDGIILSPKYGVNPTMPVCFFCGKEKGEVAMLGRIGDARKGEDIEAPRHMILDYEPCDECKENMAKGITMIGVVAEPMGDGRPPITSTGTTDLYPTGSWVVVSEDFIRRSINSESLVEGILKARRTVVDEEVVRDLIDPIEVTHNEEE